MGNSSLFNQRYCTKYLEGCKEKHWLSQNLLLVELNRKKRKTGYVQGFFRMA